MMSLGGNEMAKSNGTVGGWSEDKVLAVLGNNIARAGMSGSPSPVAARVLERLIEARRMAMEASARCDAIVDSVGDELDAHAAFYFETLGDISEVLGA